MKHEEQNFACVGEVIGNSSSCSVSVLAEYDFCAIAELKL